MSGDGDVDCLEGAIAGVGHGLEIAGNAAVDLGEGGVSEAAGYLLLDLGHAEANPGEASATDGDVAVEWLTSDNGRPASNGRVIEF